MLIGRQILQIGIISALVTACAHLDKKPATISETPAQALFAPTPLSDLPAIPSISAVVSDTTRSSVLTATGTLRPDISVYAQQLAAERRLPLKEVLGILKSARYNEAVAQLVTPQPAQKNPRHWLTYHHRFVEPKRITAGTVFWEKNRDQLARATQQYGVPASIIVSIIGIETFYGRHMGRFKILDTLTSLAFNYPPPTQPERIAMFRNQLSDFITLYVRGQIAGDIRGSYAGAIGMPQFMPGSILRYAVDGDQDGHIDLVHSVPDTILSVAHFLQQHGWQRDYPVFAPVMLPPDPSKWVDGGLQPTMDWPTLQKRGARLLPGSLGGRWQHQPLGVIDLPGASGGKIEYRVATENFFALTAYNRSYFYAASVAELAMAIEKQLALKQSHRLAKSTLP